MAAVSTLKIPNVQSSSGTGTVRGKRGQMFTSRVKVTRYVTGKRPDYAPGESSSDSEIEDDFISTQQQKTAASLVLPIAAEDLPEEATRYRDESSKFPPSSVADDSRLRRLQTHSSTAGGEVASLEVKDEPVSSSDEEEIDEETIERRRRERLRRRQQRQIAEPEILDEEQEEELPDIKEEGEGDDSHNLDFRSRFGGATANLAEDDEDEEDLDDDEIEKRRNLLKERIRQKQRAAEKEEELEVEEEGSESESEESEYEEYTDSEEETGPRLKPVFVRKRDRVTIQEKEREIVKQKEQEIQNRKIAEERKAESRRLVEATVRAEVLQEKSEKQQSQGLLDTNPQKTKGPLTEDETPLQTLTTSGKLLGKALLETGSDIDTDDDDEEEEAAYEAWKLRELRRIKRDRDEREARLKEKEEIERVRNMTEEERYLEFKNNKKVIINKMPKGKYKFLQKYYHRGSFFLTAEDDDVYKRDFAQPTLEDHFDKTILPKVMQVKNFGRSGRTKYTHLVDQDTTSFDSPWASDTVSNLKFMSTKGGGMKSIFDRPSAHKTKSGTK